MALRERAAGAGVLVLPAVVTVGKDGHATGVDAAGWGWNASRYSLEMLTEAKHEHELQPDKRIHFHLDSRMMGVGGYDSWTPNVDNQYLINSGSKFRTNFMMVPILENDDLHELYYNHMSCKTT